MSYLDNLRDIFSGGTSLPLDSSASARVIRAAMRGGDYCICVNWHYDSASRGGLNDSVGLDVTWNNHFDIEKKENATGRRGTFRTSRCIVDYVQESFRREEESFSGIGHWYNFYDPISDRTVCYHTEIVSDIGSGDMIGFFIGMGEAKGRSFDSKLALKCCYGCFVDNGEVKVCKQSRRQGDIRMRTSAITPATYIKGVNRIMRGIDAWTQDIFGEYSENGYGFVRYDDLVR